MNDAAEESAWGVHGQLDNLKTLMRDGRGWGIFRNIRVLDSKCVLDTCLTSGEPRNTLFQGGGTSSYSGKVSIKLGPKPAKPFNIFLSFVHYYRLSTLNMC